ncbi:putative serine/threonine-protein kinase MARK-B [Diplonema papillatum]|nr:putative serine/threonine-protein kinase MARK-B [Diplonema papillatum]
MAQREIEAACRERGIHVNDDRNGSSTQFGKMLFQNEQARRAVHQGVHEGNEVAIKVVGIVSAAHLLQVHTEVANHRRVQNASEYIVKLHAHYYSMSRKSLCFVLEYCPGKSLADAKKRVAPSWKQSCRFVAHLLKGLEAAHKCNVAHRDLKLQNVALTSSNYNECKLKILDFGESTGSTGSTFTGTPGFMPPEIARTQRECVVYQTRPADWYSLGKTVRTLFDRLVPPNPKMRRYTDEFIDKTSGPQAERYSWSWDQSEGTADVSESRFYKMCMQAEREIDDMCRAKVTLSRLTEGILGTSTSLGSSWDTKDGTANVNVDRGIVAWATGAGFIISRLPAAEPFSLSPEKPLVIPKAGEITAVGHDLQLASEAKKTNDVEKVVLTTATSFPVSRLQKVRPTVFIPGNRPALLLKTPASFVQSRRLGYRPEVLLALSEHFVVYVNPSQRSTLLFTQLAQAGSGEEDETYNRTFEAHTIVSVHAASVHLLIHLHDDRTGDTVLKLMKVSAFYGTPTGDDASYVNVHEQITVLKTANPVTGCCITVNNDLSPVVSWMEQDRVHCKTCVAVSQRDESDDDPAGPPAWERHLRQQLAERDSAEMGGAYEKHAWQVPAEGAKAFFPSARGTHVAVAREKTVEIWERAGPARKAVLTHRVDADWATLKGATLAQLPLGDLEEQCPAEEGAAYTISAFDAQPAGGGGGGGGDRVFLSVASDTSSWIFGPSVAVHTYALLTKEERGNEVGAKPARLDKLSLPCLAGSTARVFFTDIPASSLSDGACRPIVALMQCDELAPSYSLQYFPKVNMPSLLCGNEARGAGWTSGKQHLPAVSTAPDTREAFFQSLRKLVPAAKTAIDWRSILVETTGYPKAPFQLTTVLYKTESELYIVPYDRTKPTLVLPLSTFTVHSKSAKSFEIRLGHNLPPVVATAQCEQDCQSVVSHLSQESAKEDLKVALTKEVNIAHVIALKASTDRNSVGLLAFLQCDPPAYPGYCH